MTRRLSDNFSRDLLFEIADAMPLDVTEGVSAVRIKFVTTSGCVMRMAFSGDQSAVIEAERGRSQDAVKALVLTRLKNAEEQLQNEIDKKHAPVFGGTCGLE